MEMLVMKVSFTVVPLSALKAWSNVDTAPRI
jgi:hypothetical protein